MQSIIIRTRGTLLFALEPGGAWLTSQVFSNSRLVLKKEGGMAPSFHSLTSMKRYYLTLIFVLPAVAQNPKAIKNANSTIPGPVHGANAKE